MADTNDARKKLLDLMAEHPDYPIIARVDSDVACEGDLYSWYFGNVTDAYVDEILEYGDKVYNDRSEWIADYHDEHCDDMKYENYSASDIWDDAQVVCGKQPWRKVIYIDVEPFGGVE